MTTTNRQAAEAGKQAEDLINQLTNPSPPMQQDEPQPEDVQESQPTPKADSTDTEPDEGEWEKRYKSFKSYSDKTVYDLRRQNKELEEVKTKLDALVAENEQLKQSTPAPETPEEVLKLFSKDEVDGISKVVDPKVKVLEEQVRQLTNKLFTIEEFNEGEIDKANKASLLNTVAEHVENFNEINNSQGFRDYMNSPDEYGNLRFDLLQIAKASTPPDIGRIVAFYSDYVSLQTTPAKKQDKRYTQKELMQAPKSVASNPNSPQQQTKRTSGHDWSNLEVINKFYKDKAAKKIPPALAAELEQDMQNFYYGGNKR